MGQTSPMHARTEYQHGPSSETKTKANQLAARAVKAAEQQLQKGSKARSRGQQLKAPQKHGGSERCEMGETALLQQTERARDEEVEGLEDSDSEDESQLRDVEEGWKRTL